MQVGGGRSSFEIFSVDTPIVMHYKRTSILQLTYGMYRTMNIPGEEVIANTDEDYVNFALAIGSNREREHQIRGLIRSRKHLLYESDLVIQEWEYFLSYIMYNEKLHTTPYLRQRSINAFEGSIIELSPNMFFSKKSEENEHRSSSYAIKFRNASNNAMVTAYLRGGNENVSLIANEVCKRISWIKAEDRVDPVMCEFIRTTLGHGEQRVNESVVANYPVRFAATNDAWTEDVIIHHGDDLQAVSSYYGLILGLNNEGIDHIFRFLKRNHQNHSSPQWVNTRRLQYFSNQNMGSIDDSDNDCYITVALTTCKRIHLFRETMHALESNNMFQMDAICEVIVVDDSSSLDDRMHMINDFPHLTYVLKPPSDKGHAKSMNLIQRLTKTRYLFYIEDDWKSLNNIDLVIQEAMITLRDETITNNPVAQVLLNDQRSRDCAEGQSTCLLTSTVAGWER